VVAVGARAAVVAEAAAVGAAKSQLAYLLIGYTELRKFENNAGACPAGSAPALFFLLENLGRADQVAGRNSTLMAAPALLKS
jgi:hypothetical protein